MSDNVRPETFLQPTKVSFSKINTLLKEVKSKSEIPTFIAGILYGAVY